MIQSGGIWGDVLVAVTQAMFLTEKEVLKRELKKV